MTGKRLDCIDHRSSRPLPVPERTRTGKLTQPPSRASCQPGFRCADPPGFACPLWLPLRRTLCHRAAAGAGRQPRKETTTWPIRTLCTPWSLHFDRDGTEDFAIICDANGKDIAATHLPSTRIAVRTFQTGTFWLPESDEEAAPVLVRQLQLMTTAPKLLAACQAALAALEAELTAADPLAFTQIEWEAEPLATLRAVIAEAETTGSDA